MKADLETDRVVAENFKQLFLTYNKPWLRENLQEVLTPRTLFQHKDVIEDQMVKVFGRLAPNEIREKKKDKNSQESEKNEPNNETTTELDTSERERLREMKKEGLISLDVS